ncbi:MAG: SHOCT domain-containing protein [Firmicutes bacterium]|nr:SHOCT domain-containing protein [Bacillota bacterium]
MENEVSNRSKNRRGFILAAGIVSIVLAITGIISCVLMVVFWDWFIDLMAGLYAYDPAMDIVLFKAIMDEFRSIIIGSCVVGLILCLLAIAAGVLFVTKYAKCDDDEFKQVQTSYIVWTVVLFFSVGVIPVVLAVIPLFSGGSSNQNSGSGGSSGEEAQVEQEIKRLKELKAQGLVTEEEYSKLVVGLLSQKK